MKTLMTLLTTALLIFSTGLMAQVDTTMTSTEQYDSTRSMKADTTKIKMGKSTIIIVSGEEELEDEDDSPEELSKNRKHELTHWDGIELGWNTFFDGNGEYGPGDGNEYLDLNEWGSRYVAFNFGETKLRLIKDYVGIYTGVGFQINNYKLRNDSTLSFDGDTLVAFVDPTIDSFKKNKFRSSWVVVPLMLEFNTSSSQSNNFHLAAGVVGGYNLGNMYKQKIDRSGEKEKVSRKGEWLVEDFKVDAALRIGYKSFALSANYQLTSLFEENKAPELHTASLAFAFYFD